MTRDAPRAATGESTGRRWVRTEETRRQVLDAAKEVFIEKGYTKSGISDIVERSGSSVGSVYHHFGGKAEIYLALWEQYVSGLAKAAAEAVASARAEGAEAMDVFEAGSMAYLDAVWRRREVLPIFYAGDAPPGFEIMRVERNQEWVRRNLEVLGLGKSIEDRMTAAVLTSIIGEGARMVASRRTSRDAKRIAAHTVTLARRLSGEPPTE